MKRAKNILSVLICVAICICVLCACAAKRNAKVLNEKRLDKMGYLDDITLYENDEVEALAIQPINDCFSLVWRTPERFCEFEPGCLYDYPPYGCDEIAVEDCSQIILLKSAEGCTAVIVFEYNEQLYQFACDISFNQNGSYTFVLPKAMFSLFGGF